jgi:UDP-N-acetyl-D-glucosamine dehydrogenase
MAEEFASRELMFLFHPGLDRSEFDNLYPNESGGPSLIRARTSMLGQRGFSTVDVAAKRVLDVIVAAAGLLLLSPVIVVIALAIYLETGRPILFAQIRLGQNGRHFILYKFRKFHQKEGEDGNGGAPVTLKNDPRLTHVGKLLVRTKLDEVPQLWNVLKSGMAIVGPRPETLEFADCFQQGFQGVLNHRPGIFGPNQVFFHRESDLFPSGCNPMTFYRHVLFPLKARVDLAYFSHSNVFQDVGWIVHSLLAVAGLSSLTLRRPNWIAEIEDWLERHGEPSHACFPAFGDAARPVVCVQGLGFVGAAMALAIASARNPGGQPAYNVIGLDLQSESGLSRIDALNQGVFPFATSDVKLRSKAEEARAAGNLVASTDVKALGSAAVIVVDVPLDVKWSDSGVTLDLDVFRRAIRSIGRNMSPDALIIVETTVPPGATAHIAAPVLKEELAKRNLPDDAFMLGHSYERVMPGAQYFDSIVNMPRVFGGCDERSAQACEAFLRTILDVEEYPLTRLANTTSSELAKVLENTFRAVTIALMDEWASFAERIGVDLFEVVESIRARATHSNIRTPGFGVGGYCLTKDPLMGQLAAREIFGFDQPFPLAAMAVDINRRMPERALAKVRSALQQSLNGKRLLLLGISYREDVGDTRYSPSEIFYHAAVEEGAEVLVRDPMLDYWPEQNIPISREMPPAAGLDAVILAVPHKEYKSFDYAYWLGDHRPVFVDGFNILSADQRKRMTSLGCQVESIGRGQPV